MTALRRTVRRSLPILFIGPALVLLAVFRLWPMGEAFYLSFTHWDGFSPPTWIGWQNFDYLRSDPVFRSALTNNLLMLLAVPVWIVFPFLVASAVHSRPWGWRVFRLAFFMPALLSPVIIGVFFSIMLRGDGPVNDALGNVGLGSLERPWLVDTNTALIVLVAIIIWASFGIGVLIFLAALGSVNAEVLEAARVDGASWFRIQRHVVFWELLPIVEFWTVIVLISTFTAVFPFVYTLTNGGPGYDTYILDFDVYQEAFGNSSLGYASAIGVVLFLIVLVLVTIQLRLSRRSEAL
jgi:ABC-type sugar transport system permease subunit